MLQRPPSIKPHRYLCSTNTIVCVYVQLYMTLCNPEEWRLPSSSAHGISPGKNAGGGLSFPSPGDLPDPGIELESPGGLDIKSCPTLVTPCTITCQAPLSMGFSRQEYWSGLLFPSPEDLPNPGIEPGSLTLQADSSLIQGKPYTFLDVPQACGILVP